MEPPLWRLRRAAKILFKGSLLLVPASSYVAYKYRPRSSTDTEYHESLFTIERQPTNAVEQFLYACARQFAVVLTSNVMYHLLKGTQRVDMDDIEKLHRYIDNDRDGVPLVTIANHASCLDDPGVASLILPLKVRTDARLLRWTVCTEELCFDHPAVASFFGAGKAVPIQRGGSLYQKGLATLQNKLNQGQWVHLYAEGRVWQEQGLPLRDELGRWCSGSGRCGEPWTKVGPLKWGVGKLIANSAKLPVIVPFYHAGMHDIMPQNRENQLIHAMPQFGNDALITLRVGDPVSVTDLLDAYHVAARQRAVARNQRRIDEYSAELRRQGFSVAQVAGLLAPFEEQQARWVAAAQAQGARALAAADAAASAAAAAAGAGEGAGLVSWLLGLVGLGGDAAPATSRVAAASTPAAGGAAGGPTPAGSAAAHRPAIADPALNPRNTVEEASDHTGSSARIAGMARPLSPADAAAAAAQGRPAESEAGQNWPTLRPIEAVAVEGAHKLGAVARETAAELEERVAASAREIEGQAAELMKRLRELRGEHDPAHPPRAPLPGPHHPPHTPADGAAAAAAAGTPATAPGAAGSGASAAGPSSSSSIHRLTAVAKEVMHDVSSATHDVMHDASQRAKGVMHDVMQDMAKTVEGAVEEATGRWRASVSVPAPPTHRIPSQQHQQEAAAAKAAAAAASAAAAAEASAPAAPVVPSSAAASEGAADAAAGAAAHVAASAAAGAAPSGPRRWRAAGLGGEDGSSSSGGSHGAEEASAASAGSAVAAAGPPFALSDEPVMELIPTRTLRTGAVVPQFIEAPLRIKPPDHTFLTPAEATLEEDYRLQLYSDIASRLEGALAVLERRVMARRREQGHVESRPMETASQRFGPAWAPPTLPGVPRDGESEALQGAFAGTGAPVDTTGSPVIRALRRMLGRGPPSEPTPAQSSSAAAAGSASAAAPENTTQLR